MRNKERDGKNRGRLRKMGWRMLVLWECETKHPYKVSRKVRQFLVK